MASLHQWLFGWEKKNSFLTVATFSKVHCVNYHRCPSQSARPILVSRRFSYAFWQSRFTLLFGKVLKSDMRVGISQIENSTPTRIRTWHFCHVWYNKGTKFIVCLSVSPLVVRRTFFIKDFKEHCLVSNNAYYFLKPVYSTEYIYIIYSSEYDVNAFSKKIKENFKRGHLWDFQNA